MHGVEKIIFFNRYKMIKISAKIYETKDIEVILDDNDTLWLNEKHIEEKLGDNDLPVITNKYDPIYKMHRYGQTRIVGFFQSVNERKYENPTRKACSEYFKSYGGKNEKARRGAFHEKLRLDLYFGQIYPELLLPHYTY